MERHGFHSAGTRHLKLQTIFEDNRNGLIEEHRLRASHGVPAQFRRAPVVVSMILRLFPKQGYTVCGRHHCKNIFQVYGETFPLESFGVFSCSQPFQFQREILEVFYGQRVEQQQAVPHQPEHAQPVMQRRAYSIQD